MAEPDDYFYTSVRRALQRGTLTPFLGAGVNLAGLKEGVPFAPGARLPSGRELADYLAKEFRYPYPGAEAELVRIAQWVSSMGGGYDLYESLHEVFDHDFAPTAVHGLMARLPQFVREHGVYKDGYVEFPLIITTNYDDALERAFEAVSEPFDLLTYVAKGPNIGKFQHADATGQVTLIEDARSYEGVSMRERACLLKLHGAVHRSGEVGDDNYVVTEDDYIECLTRTEIAMFLPRRVVERMKKHFLFLGYSMRDWNLRAMLHRIRQDPTGLSSSSWVVQRGLDELDVQAWRDRRVEMYDMDLGAFSQRLAAALEMEPSVAVEQ